ncbi:MAG: hypothetical protein ABI629_09565 [bacterium]
MLLMVVPARADEAALQRKIEQLEQQQQEMLEQLKALKRDLDSERQQRTVPAAVVAPVPIAPAVPVQVAPAQAAPPVGAPSAPASPAVAAAEEPDRVAEVERRQGILTDEIRKVREFLVLPETQELKGQYGLGPGASKVYGIQRGLSIGGYGEANFSVVTNDGSGTPNTFDLERFVLYAGYKFTDWLVFNSEIEFEHATTEDTVSAGGGAAEVEFATLDFLLDPHANVRAGLMLVPIGFINTVHEPPFYFGNVRPPVETQIIPTTWRANGVGVFGEVVPGLDYKAYGLTSFNAKGYQSLNLRNARQQGNDELANDWSFVGRVDYQPLTIWSMGGTLYLGDQGQSELYGNDDIGFRKAGVFTQMYEVHSEVVSRGFEFRTLGVTTLVDDAGILSQDQFIEQQTGGQPIGKVLIGAYAEVAYNLLPVFLPDTTQYLAPWFRYSWLDTNNKVAAGFMRDRAARRQYIEFGLQYEPIPQVVLKADYHIQDAQQGILPDELRLGGGFVF